MGCCGQMAVNGQSPGSAPVVPAIAVMWEADLEDQGDVIFADGPQNITGLDGTVLGWTVANSDRAQAGAISTWGFEQGVGCNWSASVVSGSWTAALQTASRLTIPANTILTTFGIDYTSRIIVELYVSQMSWNDGSPDVGIGYAGVAGTPNNSGDRMFVTKRGFRAAAEVSLTETTAASSNYTSSPGPTADVLATVMQGAAFTGLIGNAVVGPPFVWPDYRTMVSAGSQLTTGIDTLTGTVLAISFASASVAGTARVRANRIRIRRAA